VCNEDEPGRELDLDEVLTVAVVTVAVVIYAVTVCVSRAARAIRPRLQ
jgi:hypothetical protein